MVDMSKIEVGDTIVMSDGREETVKHIHNDGSSVPYELTFTDGGVLWFSRSGRVAGFETAIEEIKKPYNDEESSNNSVESTLEERGKRYGTFEDNGEIAQSLKDVLTKGKEWSNMPLHHKEALHMICSKMSRIVTADFSYDDNYRDIIGYATLILNELEK